MRRGFGGTTFAGRFARQAAAVAAALTLCVVSLPVAVASHDQADTAPYLAVRAAAADDNMASDPRRPSVTLTVNTLEDQNDGSCSDGTCSLRDALAVAQSGDRIEFSVTGTITLTHGQLTLATDLTVSGPGAEQLIIDGGGTTRILWINEAVSTTIAGLTIANGYGQDGGGIFNRGGYLTVRECTLWNNSARYDGGGVSNRFDGTLTVYDSLFEGNSGRNGGAIDNREALTVSASVFDSNDVSTWGAGIYNYLGAVSVSNSTFTDNGENADYGGGVCNNQGTFDLLDVEFARNVAWSGGGGVHNEGHMTLTSGEFYSNASGSGGGIQNTGELLVANAVFTHNLGTSRGGGVFNTNLLTLTRGMFYDNMATWGGAIENFAQLNLSHSTLYSNTAADTGGAICSHGALTVTNSTFYSNTAGTRGGGLNNNEGTLVATNCTFSGNSADDAGGGVRNEETAVLVNTIVANSTAGGNCSGSLDEASTHGLSTDATCSPGFTETTPLSLTFAWSGWVLELITDSVGIDAGSDVHCPATDQMGIPRPLDGDGDGTATCDVGAHEYSRLHLEVFLPLTLRMGG